MNPSFNTGLDLWEHYRRGDDSQLVASLLNDIGEKDSKCLVYVISLVNREILEKDSIIIEKLDCIIDRIESFSSVQCDD